MIITNIAQTGTFRLLSLILEHLSISFDEAISEVEEHPLITLLHRREFNMADLLIKHGCNLDVVWRNTNQTPRVMINTVFLDDAISTWLKNKDNAAAGVNLTQFGLFSQEDSKEAQETHERKTFPNEIPTGVYY